MDSTQLNIKIALLGDDNVGKTAYIHRHITGEFIKKHNSTPDDFQHVLKFSSNYGIISTEIWENPTKNRTEFDAIIVMFDVTDKMSFGEATFQVESILDGKPETNIILCGNKVDIRKRSVFIKDICKQKNRLEKEFGVDIQYFDLSAKSNYNFEKPFLRIFQRILGNNFKFVEREELAPPEVSIDEELYQKIEKELLEAKSEKLPVDDWIQEFEQLSGGDKMYHRDLDKNGYEENELQKEENEYEESENEYEENEYKNEEFGKNDEETLQKHHFISNELGRMSLRAKL